MTNEVSTEVDEMCNYGQGIAERNYKRGMDDMTGLYLYLKDQDRLADYDIGMQDPDYLNALLEQYRSIQ